mgnify:CR=1 FL=1
MTKVFISYRREDSQWPADRLYSALKSSLPKKDIFLDVEDIPLGVDFKAHIDRQVAQCDLLLALIGRSWLSVRDPETGARRIDNPDDFVRLEVAFALRRGIRVVPVLIDGAPIPAAQELPADIRELASRNGVELRRSSFQDDARRLVAGLGLPNATSSDVKTQDSAKRRGGRLVGRASGPFALAVGTAISFFLWRLTGSDIDVLVYLGLALTVVGTGWAGWVASRSRSMLVLTLCVLAGATAGIAYLPLVGVITARLFPYQSVEYFALPAPFVSVLIALMVGRLMRGRI